MRKVFLLLLLGFFNCASAQKAYWQQKVDHTIHASLNVERGTVDATQTIVYQNNSPDTLRFLWMHLWPNAYKSDRTAYVKQALENGDTRPYFLRPEESGYINGIEWRSEGRLLLTEDHPEHIDIQKLILAEPLPPGATVRLTTPFHLQLPKLISRSGWKGNHFQITQWYPKPAVYDREGWHPMPYLDQGEFYNEYGDYEVRLAVPPEYVVGHTGIRIGTAEQPLTQEISDTTLQTAIQSGSGSLRFYRLQQKGVHDFAIILNPTFRTTETTLTSIDGRSILIRILHLPTAAKAWDSATHYAKRAVAFYEAEVGPYPYETLTVAQSLYGAGGGMEYPGLALVENVGSSRDLDLVIAHEIGHNWFQAALGSNERAHPWMDEGINTFYENMYRRRMYTRAEVGMQPLLETQNRTGRAQPIGTPADSMSSVNYGLITYYEAARWMDAIANSWGVDTFRLAMKDYFGKWNGKHPQPADLKEILSHYERSTGDAARYFALLNTPSKPSKSLRKGFRILTPFSGKAIQEQATHSDKTPIFLSPVVGFNKYDRWMPGLLLTNYLLPPSKLQFLLAPLYSTGAKRWTGIGKVGATHYMPGGAKLVAAVNGATFSTNSYPDSIGGKRFEAFQKISPSLRYQWPESPRSTRQRWVEARSYFIEERGFAKFVTAGNGENFVDSTAVSNRNFHQLSFYLADHRKLYPYDVQLQAQAGRGFYRVSGTLHYGFNYAGGGGANLRLFGAKFGTMGNRSPFETFRYRPKLLGVTGEEDYSYSNYFLGRSASAANATGIGDNAGLAVRQIMMRDGGLKLRADAYEFLQGRSGNWVAAINLNTTLPTKLFPVTLPLRLFFDLGTYAEGWQRSAPTKRFLYTGGLQLSLLQETVNVYLPLLVSKEIKDNLKSSPEGFELGQRITFSIDLQRLNLRRLTNNTLLL